MTYGRRFILNCLGLTFVIVGLGGFLVPKLWNTYFTTERCLFTVACGVALLTVVQFAPHAITRVFCVLMALFFGGLAIAGFVWGVPGDRHIGIRGVDPSLLSIFDNRLELGRNDHYIHIVVAGLLLIAAIAPKSWDIPPRSDSSEP